MGAPYKYDISRLRVNLECVLLIKPLWNLTHVSAAGIKEQNCFPLIHEAIFFFKGSLLGVPYV